mgnify:CR=1 FL=1
MNKFSLRKKLKNTKGITLIALVVTIIVLLILAGVSIAMLTGNNGILTQGKRAKEEQAHAAVKEGIMLLYNEYRTKQEVNSSKVQEETKVASTELVKIAANSGAEGTTENLGSFKDFIQSKNIINANGIINVRNLLGQTLSIGNGTSKESGDVYVFEEQDDYYNLTYYNKQIQQSKIYQIKNENAGEKLIATHYFDSNTGSGRIIQVNFEQNDIYSKYHNDYDTYARNILNGKTPEEKEKIFVDGASYQDIKSGYITEPYKNFQDFSNKWCNGKYKNLEELVKNESPFDSVDESLIEGGFVNPKEYDQLMDRGPVTGTITCPNGSKVEVSEANNYESIRYPISQPGTYTFTAVTSEGKSSKIDVKVEEEYVIEGNRKVRLKNGFGEIVEITSENKPKVKYIKDSVEQEGDLTDCIDNGLINFRRIHSKFGLSQGTNVEITIEVKGKELKWSGLLEWDE